MAAAVASTATATATAASSSCSSSSCSSSSSSSSSCRALPTRSTTIRRRAVECCAASSKAPAIGSSSLRCPASAPAPSRFVLPPQMIPIPVVIEIDQDEEDELTFLDYDDDETKKSSTWLTSEYLSLRLRCSSLMMKEATDALNRHFKGREPTVSVNSMLNNTTAEKASSACTDRKKKKETDKNRHRQLNLISESYLGDTSKFIKDVVLSDEQEGYFLF